jgi:Holliday junction resolvase RusA-like endonuclease
MATVAAYAREAYSGELLEGALELTLMFRLVKPKSSKRKYPTVRPDLTKLIRSTEDAMKGIIWHDDSQVVLQQTKKVYVDRDPGVQIIVTTLD